MRMRANLRLEGNLYKSKRDEIYKKLEPAGFKPISRFCKR